jgi:hypothetical protein
LVDRRVETTRQWRINNRDKLKQYNENWMNKHGFRKRPVLSKKVRFAENIIRTYPELKAKECEFCGATENLYAHHPDYDYPLVVVTCCSSCHAFIHRGKE